MSWSWTPVEEEPIHVYHAKLWENKAENFAYEIFNWVMVPLYVAIFGHLPPRISEIIVTNLRNFVD